MSRANLVLLKAQQREDESIRLRKHIIKSNSFAITNTNTANNATNLFDYITESDNKYVDRIKSLQSFKTKSKEKTKVTTTTTIVITTTTTVITTTTITTTIIIITVNTNDIIIN